jgi:hypothetical protein
LVLEDLLSSNRSLNQYSWESCIGLLKEERGIPFPLSLPALYQQRPGESADSNSVRSPWVKYNNQSWVWWFTPEIPAV